MIIKKINRVLFLLICILTIYTITSMVITAIKSNPTQPVRSVIIEKDYDNPGSYHIDKSARWIDTDKAEITFGVNTVPFTDGRYKDAIFVIDMSGSMVGNRLETAKKNAKELAEVLLNDEHNSIALITFDTNSEILSGFTNDKNLIIDEIENLSYRGATNYNAALLNVIDVLDGYSEKDNTDLVVLFLTDGHPNEDTPNQISTYHILKNMFPNLTIHGVQYEMGNSVVEEIRLISDKQWIADIDSLHNVLFDAILAPLQYEKFEIVDYIDKDYFYIDSINDINVSMGNAKIEEENGYQKIIWNIDNFYTGNNASMKINVKLKDEYVSNEGLYPTNEKEEINSKIINQNEIKYESDKTPVLKNFYKVIYDTNTPDGCTLDSIDSENHFIFTNVTKKQDKLSCVGYLFKGFKIVNNDVIRVNDDTFIMPEHDVTLKAIWSRVDISKSMDGKIYEKTSLYKAIENKYLNADEVYLYEDDVNDGGGNKNIYYYSNYDATSNNVNFADYCWKIIRTTDTGGVKLLYNGKPDESGKCGLDRGDNNEGLSNKSELNLNGNYVYGTNYTYDKENSKFILTGEMNNATWNNDTYESLIGKYTCQSVNDNCQKLYYIDSYKSNTSAYVISHTNNNNYKMIGNGRYSKKYNVVGSVGYMNNTLYDPNHRNVHSGVKVINMSSINTEFYYSNSYSINENKYQLVNAQRIGSTDNYKNMNGMYTFRNSSNPNYSDRILCYIVKVSGSYMYYIELHGGESLESVDKTLVFGDELVDNHDGTYTVSGNLNYVKYSEWYNKYQDSESKYTCNSENVICTDVYYVTGSANTMYYYTNASNYMKFGNSFTYDEDNEMYTLVDVNDNFLIDANVYKNHHYTCFNSSGICQNISYIISYTNDGFQGLGYLNFNGGKSITDVLNEMLNDEDVNKNNSEIKNVIDYWYKINMNKYTNYLEDIIFCNDRSIKNFGRYDPNGGKLTDKLVFGNDNKLVCPNKIDSFTVSNEIGNKSLTYPVGLITEQEYNLWNSNSEKFWTLTPSSDDKYDADLLMYNGKGSYKVYENYDFRPVISLKPNTEYTEGDGTEDRPFYVPTN